MRSACHDRQGGMQLAEQRADAAAALREARAAEDRLRSHSCAHGDSAERAAAEAARAAGALAEASRRESAVAEREAALAAKEADVRLAQGSVQDVAAELQVRSLA
jgi:hypothetical protein